MFPPCLWSMAHHRGMNFIIHLPGDAIAMNMLIHLPTIKKTYTKHSNSYSSLVNVILPHCYEYAGSPVVLVELNPYS